MHRRGLPGHGLLLSLIHISYLYDNMANPAMYNFYTQAYPNAAEYNLLTEGADVQGMYLSLIHICCCRCWG